MGQNKQKTIKQENKSKNQEKKEKATKGLAGSLKVNKHKGGSSLNSDGLISLQDIVEQVQIKRLHQILSLLTNH